MKKLISLIIIVLVVWGLVILVQRWGTVPTYEALVTEDNAVLLVDQQPGDDVVVSYAKLSQPGYVLVYGDNPATGLPAVLGTSTLLPAGEHRGITIRHGQSYSGRMNAKIVHDDGDGVFDEAADQAVLADDGTEVSSEADTNVTASEDVALTDEELVAELEAEGYDVNEEALDDEATSEEQSMDDTQTTTSDEMMEDGTSSTEGETTVETETTVEGETTTGGDETPTDDGTMN